MIKQIIKEVLKVAGILLAGVLIGFLALCFVHLLPVDRMYENVQSSKDAINAYGNIVNGYVSTSMDNYTDCIMINEAICPIEAPLIDKAINNYHVNYWKGYEQPENLLRYLDGEQGYKYQGYSHYWGGHQVVLKLLLLAFDYSDILVMNIILQSMLIVFIIIGLQRSKKEFVIIPFCIAVLTMMPSAIAVCLQFSTVFYTTLFGILFIVWRYPYLKKENQCYIFLLIGMATSYFDFLTYPFVSLGLPLVVSIAYMAEDKLGRQIRNVVINSALWGIGYLGMWSGKWILGSILSPESGSLKVALESIAYRGSAVAQGQVLSVFDVFLENAFIYLRKPTMILIFGAAVFFIIRILARRYRVNCFLRAIPYLIVCFYPIAWYRVARNHSFEHAFMAYRVLAITIFAGLCMLSNLASKEEKTSE